LRFYAALELSDIGDAAKRFSQGFYFPNSIDTYWYSIAVIQDRPDTLTLEYPDGFTPDNSVSRWALNAKFDLDLDPVQLELLTLYDQMDAYESNIPMLDIFNTRKYFNRSHRLLIQGGITHPLGPATSYKINMAYFDAESEDYDDITGNNWIDWSDTALVTRLSAGRIKFNTMTYSPLRKWHTINGIDFYGDGALTSDYEHTRKKSFTFTASVRHQLARIHSMSLGIDFRSYQLRYYKVNPWAGYRLNYDTSVNSPESYLSTYVRNLYGYDVYGRETDSGPDPAREPAFFALYIEDRIMMSDALFSIGFRLDRFFYDDRILRNPGSPEINYQDRTIAENEWQVQEAQWYLSPRVGVSFNAGNSSIIRANYNRLVQPPPLINSYYAKRNRDRQIISGYFPVNLNGFDFSPIRSSLIDFSLSHQFSHFLNVSATVFYKRTEDQVQVNRQSTDSTLNFITSYNPLKVQSYNWSYYRLANIGNNEVSGLDLQFKLSRTRRIQFFLNYTYTYARGTGSDELSNYTAVYRDCFGTGEYDVKALYPLDYVPVHTISLDIDYRFGDNDGGLFFQNLGMNILLTTDSGHPFTASWTWGSNSLYHLGASYITDPRSTQAIEAKNSSKTPWRFNIDLRIDKNIVMGRGFSLFLYVRVLNLLNTRQVENVYPYSGTAEIDGMINDPSRNASFKSWYGEQAIDIYNALNTTNSQSYWHLTGNELYRNPRQIFFGIRLNY